MTTTGGTSSDIDLDVSIDSASRLDYIDGSYNGGNTESVTLQPGHDYYVTVSRYYGDVVNTNLTFEITYPDDFWTGFIGCEARDD